MTVAGIVWGVVAFHKTVHTGPLMNSLHGTLKETMKRPCQRIWRFLAQLHSYPSKQLAQLAFLRALLTVFQNCRAHSHTSSTSSQTLSDHLPQELLSQALGNWPADEDSPLWENTDLLACLKDNAPSERTIIVTANGWIGQMGHPNRVRTGDLICVLLGCSVPMTLRPVDDHFEVVGDAYLDGVIFGEAIEALRRGVVGLRDFELR
ncbi:uncharacterized protein LY89DRAFT_193119 [Mollisia scopiformis]|uniref:Uncharacterized protein n=1 Tax=Mollisia scopiformis TaxID=149040 RepID=A0A194WXT2_MOLSC|nr:uncharacterized protein LY89DRAFT_193119 [Mollisia scopiformis]KUJ12783.1 hypothetical protein LY89DRAFT_193119 [Mollisia scopiformis]